MYLERKWGTEMSNESQLYSFIEKYLIDKRIEIIQNEVKFYRRLKTLDLLAKSDPAAEKMPYRPQNHRFCMSKCNDHFLPY